MNNPLQLPFHRWPLATLVFLGVLLACAVAAVARFGLNRADAVLTARASELHTLQTQLNGVRRSVPNAPTPDFIQTLPLASRPDDVVRDIGRFALAHALTVTSIGVEAHTATSTEHAKVGFNIVAGADYRTTKALLAELLGRYPTLAMQSLALQPQASDATRLDVRLVVTLLTRD